MQLGYLPKDILSSPLDPTTEGIANNVAKTIHQSLPHFEEEVTYRSSFPAWSVFGQFNSNFKNVEERANAGWLLSLCGTKPKHGADYLTAVEGTYLRLTLEGSILKRKTNWTPPGGVEHAVSVYAPSFLYADFTEAEKQSSCVTKSDQSRIVLAYFLSALLTSVLFRLSLNTMNAVPVDSSLGQESLFAAIFFGASAVVMLYFGRTKLHAVLLSTVCVLLLTLGPSMLLLIVKQGARAPEAALPAVIMLWGTIKSLLTNYLALIPVFWGWKELQIPPSRL